MLGHQGGADQVQVELGGELAGVEGVQPGVRCVAADGVDHGPGRWLLAEQVPERGVVQHVHLVIADPVQPMAGRRQVPVGPGHRRAGLGERRGQAAAQRPRGAEHQHGPARVPGLCHGHPSLGLSGRPFLASGAFLMSGSEPCSAAAARRLRRRTARVIQAAARTPSAINRYSE